MAVGGSHCPYNPLLARKASKSHSHGCLLNSYVSFNYFAGFSEAVLRASAIQSANIALDTSPPM